MLSKRKNRKKQRRKKTANNYLSNAIKISFSIQKANNGPKVADEYRKVQGENILLA